MINGIAFQWPVLEVERITSKLLGGIIRDKTY